MGIKSILDRRVFSFFILGLTFISQFSCDSDALLKPLTPLPSRIPNTQTANAIIEVTDRIPLTYKLTQEISPSSTMSGKKSVTPQPTESLLKICSPLAEHDIGALMGIISAPYDPPSPGRDERHQGVDFAYYRDGIRDSIGGEGVDFILDGVIAYIQTDRLPYGNMVIVETKFDQLFPGVTELFGIEPTQSLYHLYAHLQAPPRFQVGETVKCGEQLGIVGKSGYNIANPHLHLEVRIGSQNTSFDPMAFYDTQATKEEQSSYLFWRTSGVYKHQDPMKLFEFALLDLKNN
ncbi:MAG TPA: M23 family metallopeptidase [Anaerolineae bacterium]|nr:M23 family metallopeptidase [Anaerolineae bacterium]